MMFLLIALLSFMASALVCRMMIALSLTDIPVERSSHQHPTPVGGGLGIIAGTLIGYAYFILQSGDLSFAKFASTFTNHIKIALGFLIVLSVTFVDDMKHVSYPYRLLAQSLAALCFLSAGLVLNFPFLDGHSLKFLLEYAFTILFFISLSNVANFIDGLNGLLSGSVLCWIPFAIMQNYLHQKGIGSVYQELQGILFILFFSVLGFFIYNFHKGRIFMGDVGSVFLGLCIAITAILGQVHFASGEVILFVSGHFVLMLTPLCFLAFDVIFTLLHRLYKGIPIVTPGRDYLFHRLNIAGMSHTQVSLIYYSTVLLMGCLSLLTPLGYLPFYQLFALYALLQGGFLWAVIKKSSKK